MQADTRSDWFWPPFFVWLKNEKVKPFVKEKVLEGLIYTAKSYFEVSRPCIAFIDHPKEISKFKLLKRNRKAWCFSLDREWTTTDPESFAGEIEFNRVCHIYVGKHFQMRKIAYELVDIMLPGNQVLKSFVFQQFKAWGQIFFRTRGRSWGSAGKRRRANATWFRPRFSTAKSLEGWDVAIVICYDQLQLFSRTSKTLISPMKMMSLKSS